MIRRVLTHDERDALAIVLRYCADPLVTLIAEHEEGCFLNDSLRICLGLAEISKGDLLVSWAEGDARGAAS
jgi:hypothetical protein